MRVPDDPRHSGNPGNLVRRSLRVAPGYQDLAFGVLAMDSPDGGAGVLVGGGGYRTGVEHHDLGVGGSAGPSEAPGLKLALNGRSVSLGGAAAEVFHVKARHKVYYSDVGTIARWEAIEAAAASN